MANSKHGRVNDIDTVVTVEDVHGEGRAQGAAPQRPLRLSSRRAV